MKKPIFYLEWLSTLVLLAGVGLTSFNIYPMNVYVSFTGNLGWLIVALVWRKWSLFSVELVICLLYIAGQLKLYGLLPWA